MTKVTRVMVAAVCAGALLSAGAARAAVPASVSCAADKLKLYGKDLASRLKCWKTAVEKGEATIPPTPASKLEACLAKVDAKLSPSFTKIETKWLPKGGCATETINVPNPDDPMGPQIPATGLLRATQRVRDYLDYYIPALAPTPGPNKCQGGKFNELAKLIDKLYKCEVASAKKNGGYPTANYSPDEYLQKFEDPKLCVYKAADKFLAALQKLELKGGCATLDDGSLLKTSAIGFVGGQARLTPRRNGCGNWLTIAPETCDDGDLDDRDFCPADCVVDYCNLTGATTEYTVTVNTSTPNIAGILLFLDYPEAKVNLPGIGGDFPSGKVVPLVGVGQANDFEHALQYVAFDAFNFGQTNLVEFKFLACVGAPAPVPGDFTCTVVGTANNEQGKPVKGVTCSVSIS